MKGYIRSHVLSVLVVGLFVGGILLSQALGWWSTESRKVARKITTGEFTGKADPADIRGSYTFADIEKNFGVPVKVLAQAFGYDKEGDPAQIRAKDVEGRYGNIEGKDIGTDAIRLFVSLYAGIPYKSSEVQTGILEPAFRILKEAGKITPEKEKELLPRIVKVPGGAAPVTKGTEPAAATSGAVPAATGGAATVAKEPVSGSPGSLTTTPPKEGSTVSSTEVLIKGKTTFKEVLAWGVTKAQIEKVLGRPMPAEGTVIKDWCAKEGLEFGAIRDALQKLKP
jgi:hypothetical protein